MLGNRFSKFEEKDKTTFEKLFELLQELLIYTSGDLTEALDWLNQLDRKYNLTTPEYGMGDFIQELKDRGFIKEENEEGGVMSITSKMEQSRREIIKPPLPEPEMKIPLTEEIMHLAIRTNKLITTNP